MSKSLNNCTINVIKHSTPGVNKYQWILIDAYKYDIGFMFSPYKYDSFEQALEAWKEFANDNNITGWKIYKEGNAIQDIRTGSGTYV